MPSAASAATPAIVATDLAKAYGEVVALGGVSFEVRTGTVLGLLGPNGAGKTTAVKVLTTLLRADRGAASVLGFDVAGQAHQVRACIGLAGQHAAVDDTLSARENLRLVARLTHVEPGAATARSELLLQQFDLAEAADRLVRTSKLTPRSATTSPYALARSVATMAGVAALAADGMASSCDIRNHSVPLLSSTDTS